MKDLLQNLCIINEKQCLPLPPSLYGLPFNFKSWAWGRGGGADSHYMLVGNTLRCVIGEGGNTFGFGKKIKIISELQLFSPHLTQH